MQKRIAIGLFLAVTCGLVGCGGTKAPEVSSVSIDKDGKVAHQIVGSFDQNYYDMDGLGTMASDRVAEYCADNGADSVMLESVEEEGGSILIKINYATDKDYREFNHRDLFVGTLTQAREQGYELDSIAFISADGKPMEVGYIEDHDQTQIIIIGTKPQEELVVNTYGKVLYINQSATSDLDVAFAGKKGVHITHPNVEDGPDGNTLSYIVFE